ncbi:MerR family transcriptional regulator [Pedobacter punctiformis]|uniref:MerR family transcriptional regulator n=1 Tax=Pedobacter punctiformis TaxID=3004097 RepID=A0ABT4L7L3_9SPHI|nr:MerR family transcriptional regulator [Pedobacter sp. HCMS5-2]MCZ4243922.1 MerR family transcriptional regulator [Pedobacter sp. HCMS5-2]
MTYTISDLEQLSGIQSHTIRIWEQRYNALKPMRSQGNTRMYDDEQLKKLLNIVSLNQTGLKISKICSLSDTDLNALLSKQHQVSNEDHQAEYYISQLIKHGIAFDEAAFDRLINEFIYKYGLTDCYRRVMYPLLVRLGLMWRKDDICPAHEHFLSNIIRQKIFSAINNIPLEQGEGQTWLLFLPENEDHDIGLLFANYFLRAAKQKVIFLGSKVPLSSIEKVLSSTHIDQVLIFMINLKLVKTAQQYIDQLSEICRSTQIHLAGNGQIINQLKNINHINWFKSLDEFENIIQPRIAL